MGLSVAQSYLADILHVISQTLLAPVIIVLIALIGYGLFCIGSVVTEYFTERKHFRVETPKFLAALMSARQDVIPSVIESSGLLNRQKAALLTVYDYRVLPGDALMALIKRLVDEEETRYDRITARNNMAARVAPMIGLMGTLIPLGPGIEALGRADTAALSSSLLIAFDTTVAGLIVAAVCLVIGKIRSNWYNDYMSALDGGMATMLEKIEEMRAAGLITTQEPSDYAFLFSQHIDSSSAVRDRDPEPAPEPSATAAIAAGAVETAAAPHVEEEPAAPLADAPAAEQSAIVSEEPIPAVCEAGPVADEVASVVEETAVEVVDEPESALDEAVAPVEPSDAGVERQEPAHVREAVVDHAAAEPVVDPASDAHADAEPSVSQEAPTRQIHFEPPRRPWRSGE